jgi:hypothetical protein
MRSRATHGLGLLDLLVVLALLAVLVWVVRSDLPRRQPAPPAAPSEAAAA